MANAIVTVHGGPSSLATVLGQSSARIATAGKVRAGIKVLTRIASERPRAHEIYERGVAAGESFDQIERLLADALPKRRNPLVPRNEVEVPRTAGLAPAPASNRRGGAALAAAAGASDRGALLTLLVASSVTGVSGVERDKQSTDALAVALNLDMTKWWTATGASYFSHVSKSRILDVVTEAADANAASPLAALKKDDAVKGAEQTIAGTGWLPICLRTKAVSAAPADAEQREAGEEHRDPSRWSNRGNHDQRASEADAPKLGGVTWRWP